MALATVGRSGSKLTLTLSDEGGQELALTEGTQVEVQRADDTLKVRARRYTLDELLAQCDYSLPMTDEEREWLDAPPAGRELI